MRDIVEGIEDSIVRRDVNVTSGDRLGRGAMTKFHPDAGGKIFGIGLSRTGTLSLSTALSMLGFAVAHWSAHVGAQRGVNSWFRGDFTSDELVGIDAAADMPVPIYFRELDQRYPGSKFVLTVRDVGPWLVSLGRHFARFDLTDDPLSEYRKVVRLAAYGTYGFSEPRLRFAHAAHHQDVVRYFADRPNDLLVLDICGGDGFERLAPFVGCDVPGVPFPWEHKG